ncbi:MAG TPA: (2Fe-2S)-binding protein [Chloroflexia bacterium]|nr:(2Fe-2S)-binding protein [Chloroflexia bacterium]
MENPNKLRVPPEIDQAQVQRGEPFEFTFEGETVMAYPGESLGAALTAAGYSTFRYTRGAHKPRGLFCGIGVCYDCLVVVDNLPNQRACLTPARPGQEVKVQHGTAEDVWKNLQE